MLSLVVLWKGKFELKGRGSVVSRGWDWWVLRLGYIFRAWRIMVVLWGCDDWFS